MGSPDDAPGYRGALVYLLVLTGAFLVVCVVFVTSAPQVVPSHFGTGGQVDGYTSKTAMVTVIGSLGLGLAILLGVPWPWGRWPAVLNVPYKDEWIRSGHRQGLTNRIVVFMRLLAGLLCALLSVIMLVVLTDARADSPGEGTPGWVFPSLIVLFLAGVGLCTWKVFRDLRPIW